MVTTESILESVKEGIGVLGAYDDAFDSQILTHINTVFMTLNQLGVGTEEPFFISDETTTWSDFLGSDKNYEAVKTYVILKVRLLFDPPTGSLYNALKETVNELEWRLNVQCGWPSSPAYKEE